MGATEPSTPAAVEKPDPDRVRDRLDRVNDPELDRSLVDLDYIEQVEIDGSTVSVAFVLPTAWCSPAFAWMMATGIRDEVESLPSVDDVTVNLEDHMHAEEISTGVTMGKSFEEVFEDATDGIDAVRAKLDEKARFARQFEAMRALREAGLDDMQIARLTPSVVDLDFAPNVAAVSVRSSTLTVTVPREPIADYLVKARETGLVSTQSDRLFADREGEPLDADPKTVAAVYREARLASSNIEGQGTICASLHESRNGAESD